MLHLIISLKSKNFLDNGISSGVYFHFNLWKDKDILIEVGLLYVLLNI